MVWVRFDDQKPINRKVARLSDGAYRLHDQAIFWAVRNLTDGVVPVEDLDDVAGPVRAPRRKAAEIVSRGLWHPLGEECDSEHCPANPRNDRTDAVSNAISNGVTGWVVHDYLEYQFTRQKVKREREQNAERQRRHRDRALNAPRQGVKRDLNSAQAIRVRETEPQVTGTGNGVTDALVTAPRPVPSRPEGSVQVSTSSSGSRRTRENDDDSKTPNAQEQTIDRLITDVLSDLTGRQIDPEHAAKVRRHLLDGRQIAKPMAYVAKALRERPNDFLPAQTPPPITDEPWMRVPPLGERDNGEVNARGRAAVEAAMAAARAAKNPGDAEP